MFSQSRISALIWVTCFAIGSAPAGAQIASFASNASDVSGSTGASAVALGVPDYFFVNDVGLGFGGTSADIFDVGETAELSFAVPLLNIPMQHDLVVSAFVGGLGATDNANVLVEVSSDGTSFVAVASFDTQDARNRSQDRQENDFAGVKHFFIEFGSENFVTHIRLTNLDGTSEGLRLDAVEGLHPEVSSAHAFEIRFERKRPDFYMWFSVQIKNISEPGGVAIREFRMVRSAAPTAELQNTRRTLFGVDGDLICVENCTPNGGPLIPFSRHAWSLDGLVEAPAGVGLDPGRQVAGARDETFDIDNTDYLAGMTFQVIFVDGFVHEFTYDDDVVKAIGSLYQKYLYTHAAPVESWNRPVDYYQFVDDGVISVPVPTLSPPFYGLLVLLSLASTGWFIRSRSDRASFGSASPGS